MKKFLFLFTLFFALFLIYGYYNANNNYTSYQNNANKSDRQKAHALLSYVSGLLVQDLLAVSNYNFPGFPVCQPYSQKFVACLAQRMSLSYTDKISFNENHFHDYTTNQHVTFYLDGKCADNHSCYAKYTVQNNKFGITHVNIPLKINNGKVVTAKKYTSAGFKKVVTQNKVKMN